MVKRFPSNIKNFSVLFHENWQMGSSNGMLGRDWSGTTDFPDRFKRFLAYFIQ